MNSFQKQIDDIKNTQKEQKELIDECFKQINWCKDTVENIGGYIDYQGYNNNLSQQCIDIFFEIDKINLIIKDIQKKLELL